MPHKANQMALHGNYLRACIMIGTFARCTMQAVRIRPVFQVQLFWKGNHMKKITIITGHYGCGKTNLAVNLALKLADAKEKVTIVDFDIVNPYFRTADFKSLFESRGVTLAASMYANTSLDIPAISFDLERMAYEPGYLIIDVGGDDAGAIGLGRYANALTSYPADQLDMWYVINCYRYLTESPEEALSLMYEIEAVSRIRHTGIFHNSNLGKETTAQTILDAIPYSKKMAEMANLPLVGTAFRKDINLSVNNGFPVDIYVKPVWDLEE